MQNIFYIFESIKTKNINQNVMKKITIPAIVFCLAIITLQAGCKKDKDESVPQKQLDYVTDSSGIFRLDMVDP